MHFPPSNLNNRPDNNFSHQQQFDPSMQPQQQQYFYQLNPYQPRHWPGHLTTHPWQVPQHHTQPLDSLPFNNQHLWNHGVVCQHFSQVPHPIRPTSITQPSAYIPNISLPPDGDYHFPMSQAVCPPGVNRLYDSPQFGPHAANLQHAHLAQQSQYHQNHHQNQNQQYHGQPWQQHPLFMSPAYISDHQARQYQHLHPTPRNTSTPQMNHAAPIEQQQRRRQEQQEHSHLLPVHQASTTHSFRGSTHETPIEIYEDAEVTSQQPRYPREQQQEVQQEAQQQNQEQTSIPSVPAIPSKPALKKPENSFFTERFAVVGVTGKKTLDKNGKTMRCSIDDIVRQGNVSRARYSAPAYKKMSAAQLQKLMLEEELAKTEKVAKEIKAKESGLASPEPEQPGSESSFSSMLTPASKKRKSAEADDEAERGAEPLSKRLKAGTEEEVAYEPLVEEYLVSEDEQSVFGDLEVVETSTSGNCDVTTSSDCSKEVFDVFIVPISQKDDEINVWSSSEEIPEPPNGRYSGIRPNSVAQEEAEVEEKEEDEEGEEEEMVEGETEDEEGQLDYTAADDAWLAAELERELEETDEEEEGIRPFSRASSVTSDEDEDEDFIGNRKYARH